MNRLTSWLREIAWLPVLAVAAAVAAVVLAVGAWLFFWGVFLLVLALTGLAVTLAIVSLRGD